MRESKLHGLGVLALLLSAAWMVGVGCKGSALNPKSDLELRFDAAKLETVTSDRDKSMSSIAEDSAEEGNYRLALQALKMITDPVLRDTTAQECAIRLVKAGDRTDANKLPPMIQDPEIRNKTLRRLANNDVGQTDPAVPDTQPQLKP